jgi:hypothetical protein
MDKSTIVVPSADLLRKLAISTGSSNNNQPKVLWTIA